MKVTNKNYANIQELNTQLDLSNIKVENTLIQVFTGLITENDVNEIHSLIKSKNSQALFVGSTTAGEIYEGTVQENSINISIVEFENTTVKQGYFIDEDDFTLGSKIAKSLFRDNSKAMILFIDGLQTNGNDVVDGISSINTTIPLAGGMAGDNGGFVQTFVFDSNGVYSKGCVAVSLNSDVLNVFTDYQLNWQPIGQTMTVSKAEKNRLYEIDGISASEIYRKYLGDKVGDNLPFSATEFPLLKIEDDGLEICRTFVHQFEEDGSLLTIGNLEVGDKVKLAFGNVDLVLNSTKDNVQEYQKFQPDAIFTYSCTARRAFLQSEIVTELNPLNSIAPNCGFFTYGEIFHKNNKNSLLNITLTIFGLSENSIDNKNTETLGSVKEDDESEKNFITNKHFLVLDALTHLSNTVIEEIDKAHKKIQDSIKFASLIQNAILPNVEILNSYTNDNFALWQPKDTVGGDIYFVTELESKEEILIMVIDGAGHGVPGAFVTMLVKAIENQITAEIKAKTLEPSPALILEYFNRSIKTMLQQEKGSKSNAGFDGGVLYYNKTTKKCKYAGAKTDLYIIDDNELNIISGDKKNVGFIRTKMDQKYTQHDITLKEDTKLYISTDGIFDQEGENKTRYGLQRFENFLLEINNHPFHKQSELLMDSFTEFKKSINQTDDITTIGFNFK